MPFWHAEPSDALSQSVLSINVTPICLYLWIGLSDWQWNHHSGLRKGNLVAKAETHPDPNPSKFVAVYLLMHWSGPFSTTDLSSSLACSCSGFPTKSLQLLVCFCVLWLFRYQGFISLSWINKLASQITLINLKLQLRRFKWNMDCWRYWVNYTIPFQVDYSMK